jgi:hypothetical protein
MKVHEHRELRVLHVSLHEFAFAIASVWECMCTRMHGCVHKCVQENIFMSNVLYCTVVHTTYPLTRACGPQWRAGLQSHVELIMRLESQWYYPVCIPHHYTSPRAANITTHSI